jgi:broad specificity phosphatase PhoE
MRLFLIRHGQTEWNNSSRAQGHTDVSLDETGFRQSEMLGEAFRNIKIDKVITSDLKRSWQTAEPISRVTGAPMVRDARIRERTFGDWEGFDYQMVGEQMRELEHTHNLSVYETRPPNGESMLDVWERLKPAIAEIRKEEGNVVVVSHGGASALILAMLIGGPIEVSRAFRFANTGLTELHSRPDGALYIKRYNDTAHLATDQVLSGDLDLENAHR